MITIDQARRIALSFPGAEELQHQGHPDFRVANRIFVSLRPGEERAVVKLDAGEQADLVQEEGSKFSLNAWSKQGWTEIHLDQISASEFRAVVEASWRRVAPKKLVAAFRPDEGG